MHFLHASRELMSLIMRGRRDDENMWAGTRFLCKATPRLRPATTWISGEALGTSPCVCACVCVCVFVNLFVCVCLTSVGSETYADLWNDFVECVVPVVLQ